MVRNSFNMILNPEISLGPWKRNVFACTAIVIWNLQNNLLYGFNKNQINLYNIIEIKFSDLKTQAVKMFFWFNSIGE